MAIQIGETKLATRHPANLDEQLLESTGCSSAEVAAILARNGSPALAARALQPFLTGADKMDVTDLAQLIEQDDTATLPGLVATLLGLPGEAAAGTDA